MHLRLVEPHGEGHHIALYARHIASEAARRGWRVSLATTHACLAHPSIGLLRTAVPSVEILPVLAEVPFPHGSSSPRNLLRYQFAQARAFRAATATRDRPDMLYLINLDYCDKAMAVAGSPFGTIPFAGMLMSARFHHPRMGVATPPQSLSRVYEWLFGRLLAIPRFASLLTVDETLAEYAASRAASRYRKVRYVPELSASAPRADRDAARSRLAVPPERDVILLYGALSLRKGVRQLVEAAAEGPGLGTLTVLLVGMPDAEAREYLSGPTAARLRAEGRLVEHLRFVSEDEAADAFAAADLAWLGYDRFYSMSGVLLQAARAGLPSISTREGLIGWMTMRHGLGKVVDVGNPPSVRDGLLALLRDAEARRAITERSLALGAAHDAGVGAARICDAIEDALVTR